MYEKQAFTLEQKIKWYDAMAMAITDRWLGHFKWGKALHTHSYGWVVFFFFSALSLSLLYEIISLRLQWFPICSLSSHDFFLLFISFCLVVPFREFFLVALLYYPFLLYNSAFQCFFSPSFMLKFHLSIQRNSILERVKALRVYMHRQKNAVFFRGKLNR